MIGFIKALNFNGTEGLNLFQGCRNKERRVIGSLLLGAGNLG